MSAVIPSAWTVSDVVNDYGLDLRVEIFEQGHATSHSFWIQLKGTDEPDLRKALRRSFDLSSLAYMSAQADPVLLVRYHSPTRALFGQWLHAKDIVLKKTAQKSYTVKWVLSDRLDSVTAETLADETRRFRRFSGPVGEALTAGLDLPPRLASSRTAILMLLASKSSSAGGLLTFPPHGPYDVTVKLTPSMIKVDMSVVSIRAETLPIDSAAVAADDILIAAAVCLARLGRADAAADLVTACPDAALLGNEDVAQRLAPAFGAAGRWRQGSDLALAYELGGRACLLSDLLAFDPILRADDVPASDARHVADNLARAAADKEHRGDDLAGAAWYTVANFLFHRVHDYGAALDAYERAARNRPDYLDQEYYLAETAAALFETARYAEAADMYERAWSSAASADARLLAKRADALAHDSRHADALKLFRRYEKAEADPDGIWLLKRSALEALTASADQADVETGSDGGAAQAVSELVLHPGLQAEAWERRTADAIAAGDVGHALGFLTAACAYPADSVASPWPLLLGVAHALGEQEIFNAAVDAGWHGDGEAFVADVLTAIDAPPAGFVDDFNAGVASARDRRPPFLTLRLLHDDGTRQVERIDR